MSDSNDPVECPDCAGEGGSNEFVPCRRCHGEQYLTREAATAPLRERTALPEAVERLLARADEYRGLVGELDAFRELSALLRADPIERVDPRDFLDPTARAVAYLDLDDLDGARRALAEVSLARLRVLGEHYDRLSMVCFELAAPGQHTPDDTVPVSAVAATPAAELPGMWEHADLVGGRTDQPAPVVDFDTALDDDLLGGA